MVRTPRVALLAGLAGITLLAPFAARAQETITVTYSERPPYIQVGADGVPGGLTGTPTVNAFKAAGIPVIWSKVPSNRQLLMVKEQIGMNCAIGWFWLAEREHFAKFSKPIYRDKEWVALANTAFAAKGYTSLEEVLQHKETRILVKDNYSYGAEFGKLISKHKPTLAISAASVAKMVQSISKGAVDLMFVSEEEGSHIIAQGGTQAANLRLLHFKDMPRGQDRYIMCSKSVPDDVINRLNKALTSK